jgi:cation diffusion facilitator family transporter
MAHSHSNNNSRVAEAKHVTWVGFWANIVLTLFKFAAGVLGRSSAMIADAMHSLSDFITDLVLIFTFRIVSKPVDKTHDYGHGKFETLASNFVGVALIAVGLGILWSGGRKIYLAVHGEILVEPGWIALIAAIFSIFVKEALYRYQVVAGKKINSQAIIANAWHHRSDAFSSIATMIGIGGAMVLGENWRVLDPIAAVLVSFLILKVAIPIFWESMQELLEVSLGEDMKEQIVMAVNSIPGAEEPHNLKTRKIGNYVAVDLHIRVDQTLSIVEAHDISKAVENKLKEALGEEAFVSVHVDPLKTKDSTL